MTQRRRTWIVSLACASLLASACRSTPRASTRAEPLSVAGRIDGDARLAQGFSLLAPAFHEQGGVRHAQFELLNTTSRPVEVLYHVEWYDTRAARIEILPQVWHPLALGAAARVSVRAEAPGAHAASFRLLFQRPEALKN